MKRLQSISAATLLLAVLLLIYGCRDKEEQGPVLGVSPSDLVLNRNAGDLLEFSITATAGDNELRQMRITQKPEFGVTSTALDTTLYGNSADFFFIYTVPTGTNRVLLTFTLYDTDGKSYATIRDLNVNEGSTLNETTGYELYSAYTPGANNVFTISNLNFEQLDTNPDSTLVDLVEKDLTDNEEISRTLTSLSGIRYVRNNAFNYAQATATSAANSYSSSSAQQLIPNIAVNDILITKYDTVLNKYAVIKITGVFDEVGTSLDRYMFNIKK